MVASRPFHENSGIHLPSRQRGGIHTGTEFADLLPDGRWRAMRQNSTSAAISFRATSAAFRPGNNSTYHSDIGTPASYLQAQLDYGWLAPAVAGQLPPTPQSLVCAACARRPERRRLDPDRDRADRFRAPEPFAKPASESSPPASGAPHESLRQQQGAAAPRRVGCRRRRQRAGTDPCPHRADRSLQFPLPFCWTQDPERLAELRGFADFDSTGARRFELPRAAGADRRTRRRRHPGCFFVAVGDPLVYPQIELAIARARENGLAIGVTSNLAMKISPALARNWRARMVGA